MDGDDSQGLLKSVLGFFARKRPERLAQPRSLRSRTREAWLRTDAYLQHDADELGEIDPERLAKTLRTMEDYVQFDSDRESDFVSTLGIRQASVFQPDFLSTNKRSWSRTCNTMCHIPNFRRCAV